MKFSRLSAATLVTASLLLSGNTAMAAAATDRPVPATQKAGQSADESIDKLSAIVEKATSKGLATADKSATPAKDGSFRTAGDIAVAIPRDSAGVVAATKHSATGSVTVSVGTGAEDHANGVLAADGSVVYSATGSTDQTVQPTSDGFRIHSVIADASAGTEIEHSVTLPAGAELVAEKDMPAGENLPKGATVAGAVFAVDSDGNVLGGFSAPWAKDANGVAVATHFEIRSGNLVQVIDHRAAGVAYPVVADPYFGYDLIKSARWNHHSGAGWTLEVTPTGWARWNAGGYVPGVYGWKELYSKYRYRGLNTNLDGMRDQYICHQQVVALRAPNKATWNLDEWRKNVSYWQTVNASCNPGGSKWFD